MVDEKKVFGIGFHKTGTTSLSEALRILSYKTIHGDPRKAPHGGTEGKKLLDEYIKKGNYRLPTFELYDAFTDNPYFSIWKDLVKIFPDAKYILTVRDEDKWVKSCIQYYKDRRIRPLREWMFGPYADPAKNKDSKDAWLVSYRQHNEEIIKYFKSAGKDLLVMDISKGDGWNVLCHFLNKPIPYVPFPYRNKTISPFYKLFRSLMPATFVTTVKKWLS